MIPTCLALMLVAILLFFLFILFSVMNYRNRFNMSYHLRNTFPYELNYRYSYDKNLLGNISLVLCIIAMIVFYILFDGVKKDGWYIVELISGIIASIGMGLIVFIPLDLLKPHMFVDVIFFVFTMLASASCAVGNFFRYYDLHITYNLISGIIATVLTIPSICILLNPKLKYWANLSPVKNADGTSSYVRPKYFVLAASEWLAMFILILNMAPNFIGMFSF